MNPAAFAYGGCGFLLAWLIGGPVVRTLRAYNVGKRIREEQPESHQVKAGTPTMGGIIFLAPLAAVSAGAALLGYGGVLPGVALVVMTVCAALGAVDDLRFLEGRPGDGLPLRVQLLGLLLISVVAVTLVHAFVAHLRVAVPFGPLVALGWWGVPLGVVTLWSTMSAVAITDGVDGLLGSTAAVAFAAYGLIAAFEGKAPLAAFCFAATGALLGFLWFNAHPAAVFMGNLGSLSLGGGLGMAALLTDQWLLLPLIGVVFLAEALSDLIQIGYFRLSGGRRFFRRAPLHHHFEHLGWSETQVTTRFTAVGAAGALLGLAVALR
ncbi:MAG TPA: phospho-N-acetylmuramoyl-pentapeptide-transferase [Dehalococcoidia bacterium]|nr:phospho-N-acetylmuramoyl-pentapeptide-transferase [Dehalococcoidia bacterium]